MTTTIADDALLMAYVDGELSPQQCEEVEQLMNASPEVAERVALLMSSVLPYSEAFARQAVPPVPESLTRNIDALVAEHTARAQAVTPEPTPVSRPRAPVGESESLLSRVFGKPKFGWLAVAFATGATCYGLVLQSGIFDGALNTDSALQAPAVAQVQPSPWVQQAAAYQRLYSRDTVSYVKADGEDVSRTISDIRELDGLELRVPDLSAAGLTLKRVQRLRFNGKALVQLVYLPVQGDPVALCVMKEPKPDQALTQINVAGMDVVMWRQSQLGYALIGTPQGVDLDAVARLVADRSTGQLFGAEVAPPSSLWVADIRQ
ncbi:anti-sigma factor family protein [Pseudomonas sp. X10]